MCVFRGERGGGGGRGGGGWVHKQNKTHGSLEPKHSQILVCSVWSNK